MGGTRESQPTALERAAFVVGALCLGAAVAAQGGRLSDTLDLLTHFAPIWLGGALVVAAFGGLFAGRGRRAALVAIGLSGAVAAAVLIVPEYTRPIPRSAPGARTLKVIQFNAWDQTLVPGASAAWIAREKPDLVFVEEAEPAIQAALLARGFVRSLGFGHVAIFSRAARVTRPAPLSAAEWHEIPPFARATFGHGETAYSVVAVHLSHPTHRDAANERRMFARFVNRYDPKNLIVAGDFNLTPWSFALRRLDRSLAVRRVDRADYSWPARLAIGGRRVLAIPVLPIDHIYAGPGWRLVSVTRGPAPGSDHYPLVVVLTASD